MPARRIDARTAHERLEQGALLVCAYDDPDMCAQYHLHGAISLEELQQQESSMPKDREIIFYCA